MAEVTVQMRAIPARPGAWRGLERYELWGWAWPFDESWPENNHLHRWCEISYALTPDGKLTTGYHAKNKRYVSIGGGPMRALGNAP